MAERRSRLPPQRRLLEWSVLASVVLVIAGVLGYYGRLVQVDAERAAVVQMLGGLRTAMVLDHLVRVARGGTPSTDAMSANPFLLVSALPQNYRGEMSVTQVLATSPGGWWYDSQCQCVGYAPLNPAWLEQPEGATLLWFKVGRGPGPGQLTPMSTYVWRGQVIR